MKKSEAALVGSAGLLALIVILYLLANRKRQDEEILDLQNENRLYKEALQQLKNHLTEMYNEQDLGEQAKKELNELIEQYQDIDEKIVLELGSISNLMKSKEESKAVMAMAKILENVFKRLFEDDESFSGRKNFANFIKHAKEKGIINKKEAHFLDGIREMRNQEAHEVGVDKKQKITKAALSIGMQLALKLSYNLRHKLF